ncbi:MAG: hypothetical protein OMM_09365 [Candidatus Magnetoglobus multicellularis str. Araruama]|uniref:Uncharacterized protein n=1 Tax=Candidatus Magnetoglobus multicellularis str. Araruama TaxID=890399 RepID=A0A1V1P4F9_9BACT|nr:MAG: hypothetical protein OMM_09365 [Candidatus Magnetoglobus multicellularis str. Araruama]
MIQYQQKIDTLSEQLNQSNKKYNTLVQAYKEEKQPRINMEKWSKILINDLNKFYKQQELDYEIGKWIGDQIISFSKKVFKKGNQEEKNDENLTKGLT